MSQITLRILKGSALTQSEMDDNLRNLINSASVDKTTGQLSLFTSESSGAQKQIDIVPEWVDYSGSLAEGIASITGSLVVSGDITAQQFNTEIISSSTIFESGSTIFGDDSNDTHRITGSLLVTGSESLEGDLTVVGQEILSGSLTVSGSATITEAIDSTGMSSKIRFHFNEFDDLPSATTYHGMFAHVHATGSAYYAHGGNWVRLAQSASFAAPIATLTDASASHETSIITLTDASASHETAINTLNGKTLISSSDQISDEISGSLSSNAIEALGAGIVSSSNQISDEISGSFSADHLNSKIVGIVSSSAQVTAFGFTATEGGNLVSSSQQIDDLGFLKNEGDSVISSSVQVIDSLPAAVVSSSAQTIANLPTGTVSSSIQLPTGIVSSSVQTIANLPTGIVSSSVQTIANLPTGTVSSSAQLPGEIVSSSTQIDGLGFLQDEGDNVISSSVQITALGFGGAAGGTLSGSAEGSVQGTIELNGVDVDVNSMQTGDSPTFATITATTLLTGSSLDISGDITGSNALINGTINATGDITAYFSSDERLKDNITPIEGALDKINQIGGYGFDWNNNSEHSGHDVGVIAQEIEKVLPEVVVDRDNGYKAVRYDKIVALLINAIKEQQLQIDELKSKL